MGKSSRGMAAKDYESVGTTYDGVRVLKPKAEPTSFTIAEIRAAVKSVLAQQGALREAPLPEAAGVKKKSHKQTKSASTG